MNDDEEAESSEVMGEAMEEVANQECRLRKYLLGELDKAEQQVLEKHLLAGDEPIGLLNVVEDELFDDYLDAALNADELERFEGFFLLTPERRRKLSFAMALRRHVTGKARTKPPTRRTSVPVRRRSLADRSREGRPASGARYLGVGAAAVLVLGLALVISRASRQSEVDKGIAALACAYRTERPIESRVSRLDYAPMANTRGGEPAKVDEIALSRAELILLDEVAEHPNSKARHALGRLYLTQQKFDKAIEQLRAAETDDQQNAQLQSDLGAALLEKGKVDRNQPESGVSLEDFANSLEHLSKALSLDGSLLEALFNRGLVHQYMLLNRQAREDWEKYLQHDPNSSWAGEVRRDLKELQEQTSTTSQSREEVLEQVLNACQNRQEESAWKLVTENTEAITGKLVWWQLLGAFVDLSAKGPPARAEADRVLDALAYVGELAQRRTGDRYVSALVGFYKSSSPSQRMALLRAHQLMNSGHEFCVQSQTDKALAAYKESREQFAQAGDEWEAAFADYWIGYCYLRPNTRKSRAILEPLIEYSKRNNFLWLLAQGVNSLANLYQTAEELSKGIELTKSALQISSRIEDSYGVQKNLAQLANHYKLVNDYQHSFDQLNRVLSAARVCWPGSRQMYRTYETLAEVLIGSEFYAAAADCEKEALSLALEIQDPVFTYICYVHLGVIYERLQNPPEAVRLAQLGFDTIQHLADDPAGGNMIAYATVQLGHIYRRIGDYAAASAYYSRAIDFIGKQDEFNLVSYDALKGRVLCYVAQTQDELADQELKNVLGLTKRFRSKILEERIRNKFFDAEQGLFDVAIDFEYSRMHDVQAAFELSESSRARSLWDLINSQAAISGKKADQDILIPYLTEPLGLQEIMAKLPEHAQILQYAVLDDKVLIWVISRDRFEVAESKISLKQLKEKTFAYCNAITNNKENRLEQSKELYDILIAPVESFLDTARQICIVPDKMLNYLPFSALVSRRSGNYLIRDYTLSFSPSSSVFLSCTDDAARKNQLTVGERLLSIGNPHIDSERFPGFRPLPSATKEATAITAFYPSNRLLVEDDARAETVRAEIANSDVIHLASHYVVDDRSPLLSKLLLAKDPVNTAHPLRSSPASSEDQDGVLQAAEIYRRQPLRARLVVLSACQTAIEGYYNGEGAIGMSRTFVAAHIPLVVASLWPVDSDSTKDLMISFHRYRRSTDPISARALRRAQLEMIDGSDQRFTEPKYWASFIVIGGYAEF